jgi:hypothetical protein
MEIVGPIERGLESKNVILRNFLKNDPIRGNFMWEIDCTHFLSIKKLS